MFKRLINTVQGAVRYKLLVLVLLPILLFMPVALAPVGSTGMQHADGEILAAKAAEVHHPPGNDRIHGYAVQHPVQRFKLAFFDSAT